ncbi:MAG: hypothetical protein QOF57_858 [Frankiaceae bacterium]|nr:hypothetical protein [Frankiaceae bacterium]
MPAWRHETAVAPATCVGRVEVAANGPWRLPVAGRPRLDVLRRQHSVPATTRTCVRAVGIGRGPGNDVRAGPAPSGGRRPASIDHPDARSDGRTGLLALARRLSCGARSGRRVKAGAAADGCGHHRGLRRAVGGRSPVLVWLAAVGDRLFAVLCAKPLVGGTPYGVPFSEEQVVERNADVARVWGQFDAPPRR